MPLFGSISQEGFYLNDGVIEHCRADGDEPLFIVSKVADAS